jgi:hypothetical protein
VDADTAEPSGADHIHRQERRPEPAHDEVGLELSNAREERWAVRDGGFYDDPIGLEDAAGAANADRVLAADRAQKDLVAVAREEQRRQRETKEGDPKRGQGDPGVMLATLSGAPVSRRPKSFPLP